MTRSRGPVLAGCALAVALNGRAVGAPLAAPPADGTAAAEAAHARRFADDLFAHGDWYRASTEYLRVLSLTPDLPDAEEVAFTVARCSHRAGRHAEAGTLFLALAARASSTELRDRCLLFEAAGRSLDGRWDEARLACARARAASPGSPHADRLAYLEALGDVHGGDWAGAQAAFRDVPPASSLRPSALELAGLAERAVRARAHRPWADGALSAVLPGLGQVACGYPWDGLTTLALAGGSLAVAAEGFRRHSGRIETAGVVLAAIWYPAGILGGANAARRANRAAREERIAAIGGHSALDLE